MSSSRASHLEDIGSRHEVNRLLAPYKCLHPEFVVRFSWWMCSLAWLHRNKGFKIRTGALPGFPLCFQNYVHTPQQSLLLLCRRRAGALQASALICVGLCAKAKVQKHKTILAKGISGPGFNHTAGGRQCSVSMLSVDAAALATNWESEYLRLERQTPKP